MADNIINEKGYFWSTDTAIPDGRFAPDDAVHGSLSIAHDGEAKIELSGLIDETQRRASDIFSMRPLKNILGRLIKSDKSVMLFDASSFGLTIKTHNIDHENYIGYCCLVSDCQPNELIQIAASIRQMNMPLGDFNEWLHSNPIQVRRTKNNVYLKFRRPDDVQFILPDRTASLKFRLHAPWMGLSHHREIVLKSDSYLEYIFPHKISSLDAVRSHRQLHDFLILLSGQEINVPWPQVRALGGKYSADLYYKRFFAYKNEFESHRCWATYPQIAGEFSSLLRGWIEGSERFGPGFYLYLSTRRGHAQYYENRFMALVGGLEALHRKAGVGSRPNLQHVANKVIKIVDDHPRANGKVRKWIRKRLAYASEPALEIRLFDIINDLPVALVEASLRRFCRICADARNDIAHFGKVTRSIREEDVMQKMHDLAAALDHLYHACILSQIGVDAQILNDNLSGNNKLISVKRSLLAVGLSFRDAD